MWNYKQPVNVFFGPGESKHLKTHTAPYSDRVMVVTDPVIVKLPAVGEIVDQLKAEVFDKVRPNPTVRNVDELANRLVAAHSSVIVAIGGGSSLDCAKAASCLAVAIGRGTASSIRAYHSEDAIFNGTGLPVIAVPTTAGTGSEVTPIAVLDDEEKNFKAPLVCDAFYPERAVIDPRLTTSMPLSVTAATGLDALSHSIEGYWSRQHQPICDLLALEAGKMILDNLPKVYDSPDDIDARSAMSYASTLAGMAFQLPKNAIIHACSFPLSNRYHLPHGTACAITMEAAIELNAPHMNGRMERFAEYCGCSSIVKMIERISRLKRDGGLPTTLDEAGIPADKVEELIEDSFHPLMKNNPKEVAVDDLRAVYERIGRGGDG